MTKPMRSELIEAGGWLPPRKPVVGEIVIAKDDDGRISNILSASSNALPFRVWTPFTKSMRSGYGALAPERVVELRVSRGEGRSVSVGVHRRDEETKLFELDPSDRQQQRALFEELRSFARKLGSDFEF